MNQQATRKPERVYESLGGRQRVCFRGFQNSGERVRKKKPVDPVRQAQKNQAHRIGWLIALAGIVCGFAWLALKPF